MLYAAGSCAFLGVHPFVNLIQLFMGLLYIDEFIEGNGLHASSPYCDNAGGLAGVDSAVSIIASLIAIYITPICIYLVSQVLIPINPDMIERLDEKDRKLGLEIKYDNDDSDENENDKIKSNDVNNNETNNAYRVDDNDHIKNDRHPSNGLSDFVGIFSISSQHRGLRDT